MTNWESHISIWLIFWIVLYITNKNVIIRNSWDDTLKSQNPGNPISQMFKKQNILFVFLLVNRKKKIKKMKRALWTHHNGEVNDAGSFLILMRSPISCETPPYQRVRLEKSILKCEKAMSLRMYYRICNYFSVFFIIV